MQQCLPFCRVLVFFARVSFPAPQQFIVYLPTLTLGPAALPKNTLCQPNFLNLPTRRLFLTGFCQDRRSSRAAFSSVFLPYHANTTISVTSNRPVLALFLLLVQHFLLCFSKVEYTVDTVIDLGVEGSHFRHCCCCCCQPSEGANDDAE